jgi:hypothetical protein
MPYIIVRSYCLNPALEKAFQNSTFIDCHVDDRELAKLDTLRRDLIARRDDYTIRSGQTPDLVLNRLETLGYKVVGTNTIEKTLMWTLHKQA